MRRQLFCVAATVALCVTVASCVAGVQPDAPTQWMPPPNGLVRDAATAIEIARLVWFSENPELKRSSAESWQAGMIATLDEGIWRVRQKPLGKDSIGGGLEVDVAKRDGRIVGIYLTQ